MNSPWLRNNCFRCIPLLENNIHKREQTRKGAAKKTWARGKKQVESEVVHNMMHRHLSLQPCHAMNIEVVNAKGRGLYCLQYQHWKPPNKTPCYAEELKGQPQAHVSFWALWTSVLLLRQGREWIRIKENGEKWNTLRMSFVPISIESMRTRCKPGSVKLSTWNSFTLGSHVCKMATVTEADISSAVDGTFRQRQTFLLEIQTDI